MGDDCGAEAIVHGSVEADYALFQESRVYIIYLPDGQLWTGAVWKGGQQGQMVYGERGGDVTSMPASSNIFMDEGCGDVPIPCL